MFVGRERELDQLLDLLTSAAAGKGGTVFLSGEAGVGKQALLDEVAHRAGEGLAFLTGTCQREHEGQNAYEPFAEILVALVETSGADKARRAVVEVLKETAPDWLGMIPVVGAGLGAGVKTALRVRELYREEEQEERERLAQDRALQFLGALESRLERGPVALVIAQAQWIDGASAALLERVARFALDHAVAVLVLSRPDEIGPGHPLQAAEDELVIDEAAAHVDLAGLAEGEVAELVLALSGHRPAPEVAAWLREYTDGNPMFVAHLVPLLEESGIVVERDGVYGFHDDATAEGGTLSLAGQLAGITLPPSVARAVARQLGALGGDDRELLEVASVEGKRFLSSTLVLVAKIEERALLRRLGEVEHAHRLIRAQPVVQRGRYAYEFTHLLLQQQMYAGLSEPERVEYHGDVAAALVATFGENAPRPVLLDIARHYEEGRDPGTASRYLLRAAQSAVLDGGSATAVDLCAHGLELAREAAAQTPDPALDRVRAELVHLLVTAADAGWHETADVEALLEEGRAAAERVGDDELRARLLHAQANVLVYSKDVATALEAYREAVRLAAHAVETGHEEAAITQFAVMIDLGNATDVTSLEAGLGVLREAHELYMGRLRPATGDPDPALARLFHRLEGFLGVGEFDRGDLGEARRLLDDAIAGLDALGIPSDLPRLLNYRAQVALARGDFEGAETDVRRALEGARPGPWAAYNKAFLGKVALDAERWDDAGRLIREGWEEARADWMLGLGIVGRAYLIEYLLRPGSPAAELDEAARLIADESTEAAAAGFGYCVIWAGSLASELALRRGDAAEAVERARRSVELLDASGDLPIVRTEEVLWRYARALGAAGSPDAQAARERAAAVVERKAKTLSDDEAARMLAATPTARALAAVPADA